MARIRLPAKLTRPRLHGAVQRVRLFAHLDEARDTRRAICVVGPPGSGKTTLVTSWLEARSLSGIWYQVDAGDADLPTFFHYLGLAGAGFARRGQAPLPALTPEYLSDVDGFARRFFRALFARLPSGAVLVLDNCQEVDAGQPLHRILVEGVGELPPGTTLIAISRRDPPATYARLVANEAVALVDWDQLKLTGDETRAIANSRLSQSEAELTALHIRCDGWAAGLTLLLEGCRRQGASSWAMPSGREAIFDYFAEQIFTRVPEELKRFLVTTAFLPQVPLSLARNLTGEARAPEFLEDLHRRHLFTHRRLGSEPVYWYHALFRDFLKGHAAALVGTEQLPALLSRAARLFEAEGSFDDAFELFREAGDWAALSRLSERRAADLIARGRSKTLQEWIGALPDAVLADSPWLRYWLGTSLTATDPADARLHLELAFDGFSTHGEPLGQALAAAGIIDVYVYEWSDFRPLRRWVEAVGETFGRISFGGNATFEQRITCSFLLGMVYVTPGHPLLLPCVERVTEMLDEQLDENSKLGAAMILLAYCNLASDDQRARIAVSRGAELAADSRIAPTGCMWWQMRLGLYLGINGQYEASLRALDIAEAIAAEHGFDRTFTVNCLIPNYRLVSLMALGDVRGVRINTKRMLDSAVSVSAQPMTRFQIYYGQLYLAWATGDEAAASGMSDQWILASQETGMVFLELLARAHDVLSLAATGQHDRLPERFGAMRALADNTCFVGFRVEADLIEAWDLHTRGERSASIGILVEAMARWRMLRQQHPTLFPSSRLMRDILSLALDEGIEPDHVRETIRRLRVLPPPVPSVHWPWAVRVCTLGGFEVRVDGEVLRFTGKVPRKPLLLLKAIVAFGTTGVPVAKLVDALWPDESGDASRKSFDATLARLRKLLEHPDAVVLSDETVSLDRRLCWVDARNFVDATEAAGDSMQALEAACSLYRGEFLPGEAGEGWSARRRELLRSRFADTVERIATTAEAQGGWEKALEWYRRGIEAEQLVESFHQGAMRCLIALDRHADAMSAYRRLKHLLSVVLGMTPSAKSRELAAQASSASVDDR